MIDVVVLLQKKKKPLALCECERLDGQEGVFVFRVWPLVSVVGYVCIVFIHTLTSFILSYCG